MDLATGSVTLRQLDGYGALLTESANDRATIKMTGGLRGEASSTLPWNWQSGCADVFLAGPPRRSTSWMRLNELNGPGPAPLKRREGF